MRDMVTINHTRTAREHCALRKGFPLRPCMARAILAYTGKHYNVANTLFLLHAFTYVTTITQKSQEGEVVPELSQLYVNASRRSRDAIAKEFNLQTPLYFSYTHLVCRTAKDGMPHPPFIHCVDD